MLNIYTYLKVLYICSRYEFMYGTLWEYSASSSV